MKKKLLIMLFIYSTGYSQVKVETTKERFFPIWGEKVREMGYDLPNPYGISVMYVGMEQELDVKSVDIDFRNPVLGGIVDTLDISARDAKVDVENVTIRGDVWVLPFLNIYGIIGHTKGNIKAKGDVYGEYDPILPWNPPIEVDIKGINIDIEYDGFTYGGGFILAGGYKKFFGMIDTNYTYTSLDLIDGETKAFITTPRVGYEFSVLGRPLRLWVGAMYQNIEQTIRGKTEDLVDLGDITTGKFSVSQKGAHPWTYTTGANLEITKYLDFVVEVGHGENTSLIVGTGYRF